MPRRLLPVACLFTVLLGWRPASVQPRPSTPQTPPAARPQYKGPLGVVGAQTGITWNVYEWEVE